MLHAPESDCAEVYGIQELVVIKVLIMIIKTENHSDQLDDTSEQPTESSICIPFTQREDHGVIKFLKIRSLKVMEVIWFDLPQGYLEGH